MARRTMVRDEVVLAATRLFRERGIRSVSLQDIAQEVNLTKGALYHYFSSREDLLRQVFGDWINNELNSLLEQTLMSGSATDQLRAYVHYHVSSVANNIDLYSLSFSVEMELPPEVRAEFRRLKRRSDSVLKEILVRGTSNGEFEHRDEKVIAFAIDGMCNWLSKWYTPHGAKSADDIADEFIELILRGLRRSSENGSPVGVGGTDDTIEAAEYHARSIRFHSQRLEQLIPLLASPGLPDASAT